MPFNPTPWQRLARDLLETFGSPFVMRTKTPGAFDPGKMRDAGPSLVTEYPISRGVLVSSSFGRRFVDNDTVSKEGQVFLFAGAELPDGIEPQENWELYNGARTRMWRVTAIDTSRPDGATPLVHRCEVRT